MPGHPLFQADDGFQLNQGYHDVQMDIPRPHHQAFQLPGLPACSFAGLLFTLSRRVLRPTPGAWVMVLLGGMPHLQFCLWSLVGFLGGCLFCMP